MMKKYNTSYFVMDEKKVLYNILSCAQDNTRELIERASLTFAAINRRQLRRPP